MRSRSSFLEALTASLALPRTGLRPSGAVLRELAGRSVVLWVHAMGSYLRARGASAIHGYPVCPTGRREQRVLSGVKDGRLHRNWINRSMSACITRRATRPSAGASPAGSWVVPRRWAGGWESPAARLLLEQSVCGAGVTSWSTARPRCANLRPAPSQRAPPISQAHPALNPHVHPPPRVRVSESRLPARRQVLASPRPITPRPPAPPALAGPPLADRHHPHRQAP